MGGGDYKCKNWFLKLIKIQWNFDILKINFNKPINKSLYPYLINIKSNKTYLYLSR